MAHRQIQRLQQRLVTTEIALAKLGDKPGSDTKVLHNKVNALL
ncbi:hypothetical protein [Nostoc sp.]